MSGWWPAAPADLANKIGKLAAAGRAAAGWLAKLAGAGNLVNDGRRRTKPAKPTTSKARGSDDKRVRVSDEDKVKRWQEARQAVGR